MLFRVNEGTIYLASDPHFACDHSAYFRNQPIGDCDTVGQSVAHCLHRLAMRASVPSSAAIEPCSLRPELKGLIRTNKQKRTQPHLNVSPRNVSPTRTGQDPTNSLYPRLAILTPTMHQCFESSTVQEFRSQ